MIYEQIISLGAWCQVAHQVHRRFGRTWGGVFDWLVTPYESLLQVIEDDGERLARSFSPVEDRNSVVCNEYGVLYHHEFRRRPDGRRIFDRFSLDNCQSKFTHKIATFLTCVRSGRPTLFVRYGTFCSNPQAYPYIAEPSVFTDADAHRLDELLRRKFPNLPYTLAIVYNPEYTPASLTLTGRIVPWAMPVNIDPDDPYRWTGNDCDWDKFFSLFEYWIKEQDPFVPETKLD
jgi:hypothetical protein